jgi:hypothetical protein
MMGTAETKPTVERWSDPLPSDITFDSVESALEEVTRLISWLGYIAEHEYSDAERNKLIAVSRRFAGVAQPIANKYMD